DALQIAGGHLRARGWAAQNGKPADAVVAVGPSISGPQVLSVAKVDGKRKDVAQRVSRELLRSGWSFDIPVTGDIQGCAIRIFSMDTETGTLAPLSLARSANAIVGVKGKAGISRCLTRLIGPTKS